MSYYLFYTNEGNSTAMSEDDRVSRLELPSLGATINAACDLVRRGCIVCRIESRTGLIMERTDIESECVRRARVKV